MTPRLHGGEKAEEIRALLQSGLTQSEIAKKLGVTRQGVASVKNYSAKTAPKFNGTLLRELREKYAMNMRDLADAIETSAASIQRWEEGLQRPRLRMVKRLAQLFHVKEKELLI